MYEEGYIKLHRKLLGWEWYADLPTRVLFLHMLIKANWKDARFKGKEIKRGSFVSSIRKLAEETCLSVQEVRTALEHLKSTHEVTQSSNSKFTVFTVVSYDLYQADNTQTNKQLTNKQHTTNTQLTQIEERKNKKNSKEGKNNDITRENPYRPDLRKIKDGFELGEMPDF